MLNDVEGDELSGHAMVTQRLFHWFDYVTFVIVLAVSTAIGIFFGCFGDKQKKTVDYLLGGKSMSVVPVGVSLTASYLSGINIIGIPSELYVNGSMVLFSIIGFAMTGVVTNYVFQPVFYELQMTSSFEYLERRFSKKIRLIASVLNAINTILLVPILVYIPTITLNLVTGLSVQLISPIICAICIFYTMVGGLKTVIWTDCVQGCLIFATSCVVVILGLVQLGSFKVVWEKGVAAERLQAPVFDLSPLNRNTVWAVVLGNFCHSLSFIGVRQGFVVKYLSLPTLDKAKRSLLFLVLGISLTHAISVFTGLLIFASYSECDPIKTKMIQRADQLLPLYVMDLSPSLPGFPGVFMAGIFAASLSTMAICVNALAGHLFEDFIRPMFRHGSLSEGRTNVVLKSIVVVVGILCAFMVFIVATLSDVFELSICSASVTSGALLGLFTLGIVFPKANDKGALIGSVVSMVFVAWMVTGSLLAVKDGRLAPKPLPSSLEGCDSNITLSTNPTPEEAPDPPFILYRICFYYFPVIGTLTVLIVGMIVSYMTGAENIEDLDPTLFAPCLRKYIQGKRDANVQHFEKEMLTIRQDSNHLS